MKKADIYIIISILIPALIGAVILYTTNTHKSKTVEIYVAGELYSTHPLSPNQNDIIIHTTENNYNIIRIEADGVYMAEANCRSQICVLSGKHSHIGQMIACLPHRVLVRLTGQAEGGIDAIAY